MKGEHLQNNHLILSHADFKKVATIASGTVVTGVKPRDLHTTQEWISVEKVSSALSKEIDPEDRYPTVAYIHESEGKRKLVLGDGNTKAIIAWIRGILVEVRIEGPLPRESRYISLARLRRKYRDLFTGFEYG